MHAPPKKDHPIATVDTLKEHDAFLFGIPTRYGNMPAQIKVMTDSEHDCLCGLLTDKQTFWDMTGQLWASGALDGKAAGIFQSTAGLGSGQETTALNTISTLAHHGMIFVPLGYKYAGAQLGNIKEVHGGSPWGCGTVTDGDGSRMPSALELEIAEIHGSSFAKKAAKIVA